MIRWQLTVVGGLLGLLVLAAMSCGGVRGSMSGAGEIPAIQAPFDAAPGTGEPAREVALAEALADLAAYQPPADGDPEVFTQLLGELEQALIDLYGGDPAARARRLAAALPPEERSRAWALQCASDPGGETTLYFRGRHVGDYNMDGLVSVNDITPLGFNFGLSVSFDADGLPAVSGVNEWAAVTDGNEDGLIGVSDITPIGQNWNSRHLGYRIYLGRSSDGVNFTWETDYLPNLGDAGLPFSLAYADSREAGEVQLYSYTFTRPPLAAGEMLYARVVPFDGTAEGLATEIAVNDGPHAPFKCEVCHVMVDLAFRQPENSCHHCHSGPPEDGAQAWADAPGLHAACMSCHAAHGFSIEPPESACGTCHSSIAADVGTAGMPQCLGCHQTPHLPNAAPGPAECRGCHTEPPDVTGGDWDTAPGQHASCTQCHTRHVFAVAAPNSVCETCHSDKYDGSHGGGSTECLDCHASPHLPETSATGLNCLSCHPNPPEDLSAQWADAPGNHAQCFMCHLGEDHGNKPEPPESICGDCHSDVITGSHAPVTDPCLNCHTWPHLPQYDLQADSCVICHPTPPEKPEATWNDTPDMHNVCANCHLLSDHGDKPVPPESVCADCHGELIAGGHGGGDPECLNCHSWPHVPEVIDPEEDIHDLHLDSGVTCTNCHGVHGQFMPNRETCLTCHEEQADHHADTECSECHN